MYIVLAATWEDEDTRGIHTGDPMPRRIDRIIQRHQPHFDIVQFGASVEHLVIALIFQFGGRQLGGFRQIYTIFEHVLIAKRRQLGSRQFRSLG